MTITINNVISTCEHVTFDITAGARNVQVRTTRTEMLNAADPGDDEEMKARFLQRVISVIKESGATTLAQARGALVGTTVKI